MKERFGSVWYERQRVGQLRADSRGSIHFQYDAHWLDRDGFPVSLQLPLTNGENEVGAHGFFQGLLPEGRSRLRICRKLRIEEDDDAGLLFAIGKDCAGALSILPDNETPNDSAEPAEPITTRALQTLIRTRGQDAARITGEARRFSLAGAQEKMPVIHRDGEFFTATRAQPSTHIIKFETHPHVCFAEYTTLAMARQLGLQVIDCEFRVLPQEDEDDVPYLLIPRYDRYADADGRIHRLHQEDLIQALGYEVDFKYQKEGGPGLDDVKALLEEHTANPPVEIRRLVDWQVFNYLVGNFDGHGKNLALTYPTHTSLPTLAPFYDLVAIDFLTTVSGASYEREMAFAIGGQYVPERINKTAWEQFATDLGIRKAMLTRSLDTMSEMLPAVARQVRRDFADKFGDKALYNGLEQNIDGRCRWARQLI